MENRRAGKRRGEGREEWGEGGREREEEEEGEERRETVLPLATDSRTNSNG